jgi:hypothetical protein
MISRPGKINIRRLNILAAVIVLVNGLSRLVNLPSRGFRIFFFGIQWSIEINGRLIFMLLLAALVVVGAEAIFRSHPSLVQEPSQSVYYSTILHWILPGLAAFGGSIAVNLFPSGPRWWVGLIVVSGLLIASVICEFIVIDRDDHRFNIAAMGLNILGLTILAILFSTIHASSVRLAIALPVIGISAMILSARLLNLSIGAHSLIPVYAAGIGIIMAELALPLSFLPIPSILFGLLLTLATHTVLGIAQAALTHRLQYRVFMEYIIVDIIALILIILFAIR